MIGFVNFMTPKRTAVVLVIAGGGLCWYGLHLIGGAAILFGAFIAAIDDMPA